jgi:lipopolysaccharide transport system ATP-binding protein
MQVIRVENLSKQYFLGGAKHNSLRDAVMSFVRNPRRDQKNELWALRDVCFEVNDGEALGIIGRNGAGKSTLLKILSRITRPTAGTAEIRGRIGSLLEVGTGFHSELSGRENIFLNGAILGMKRVEIEAKFDEIVAFSEIEKFIDTPVKHYSSGMYMRLAFSVAAHLEPEILIVDEVLAVGDVAFQKKCLNKMRDVGRTGRTVLFVSHDMEAVSRLCSRAVWLKDGQLIREGETGAVISEYLHEQSHAGAEKSWEDAARAPGNEYARLRRVRVRDRQGRTAAALDIRRPVGIEMTYEVLQSGKVLVPNFHFYNEQGVCIFISHDWSDEWRTRQREPGVYTSTCWIPPNYLADGTISVKVAVSTYLPLEVHFVESDAVSFTVLDSFEGDAARGDYGGPMPGVVRPVLDWETTYRARDEK